MLSIAIHSIAIPAIYGIGRWHERRVARRAIIQRRLAVIAQESSK